MGGLEMNKVIQEGVHYQLLIVVFIQAFKQGPRGYAHEM